MHVTGSNRSKTGINPLRRSGQEVSPSRWRRGIARGSWPLAGAAVLGAFAPTAFAHELGESALHWHTSDILGVALVTALSVGALWLARRHRRGDGE